MPRAKIGPALNVRMDDDTRDMLDEMCALIASERGVPTIGAAEGIRTLIGRAWVDAHAAAVKGSKKR